MARPLSVDSRAVLAQLEKSPKTIDQLSDATGIDKVHLAYLLRDLGKAGWVTATALLRKSRWRVRVYGLARRVPPAVLVQPERTSPLSPHIAALYKAFGIGLPRARPTVRRVRGAR